MAPPRSWLELDKRSPFSILNLPFGIISSAACPALRVAVAIGDYALDLQALAAHNGFSKAPSVAQHQHVFSQPTLNAFAALGRPHHRLVRTYLQELLTDQGPHPDVLQHNADLQRQTLIPLANCELHLPMAIGDYTDFFAGLHHARNCGVLFRGSQNPLLPNYNHLPVGYHGRASSVVVSGTPIHRPRGQILVDPTAAVKTPQLAPCRKLDFELELGCFVCTPNALGEAVPVAQAADHLFGMVLMNDWSARDIQAWESVPLGPFNAKNFGTSVSPWVVLMDALEPFATSGIENDLPVLPYLDEQKRHSLYAIDLAVDLNTETGGAITVVKTSARNLLFSFPQMLAHHTVGGCPFRTGDLLGSGTISGEGAHEEGSMLEQTSNGTAPLSLANGEHRGFLKDGDVVTLRGVCGEEDYGLVGFGICVGQVLPSQ